jgi:hypothetical protein
MSRGGEPDLRSACPRREPGMALRLTATQAVGSSVMFVEVARDHPLWMVDR